MTADTVAELADRGRARCKVQNETFNVLKSNGYHPQHNSGHGKQTRASSLLALNPLAFACHTAAHLAVPAWREAVALTGDISRPALTQPQTPRPTPISVSNPRTWNC